MGSPEGQSARLADFLLLDVSAPDDHQASVVLRAVRLCGVYKVHCAVAHRGLQRGAAAMEALPQAFREAVRGHAVASRIFDTRWAAIRA